jgi:glucose-6-phosphate 1-epimerase
VHFDQEVDRNYESCGTVSLIDRAGGRTLVVEKGGSQTTVVWNPWIEKSQRLADLPDDAYHSFVCVEALSSLPEMITLAPGEEHTLSQRIHVQSL